jgi:hypothetical protein
MLLNSCLFPLYHITRSILTLAAFSIIAYLSQEPIKNLYSSNQRMNSSFDRFHLVNTYGHFGSIGRERTEVIISGCSGNDDQPGQVCANNDWHEYEFICKPGNVFNIPCIRAPYHSRLDWQVNNNQICCKHDHLYHCIYCD